MARASIVLGRYAIFDKIGSGGTATVHLGQLVGAAGFTRTVAIKRLHPHLAEEPEFISMMIDEARLAARVNHPNVVQTLDVATIDRELLVVMEYVRGESLGRLLRLQSARQKRVPLPIVSAVVSGALYGLHAAHEAKSDRGEPLGMVHRDMSPQNVLVGVDGVARMIDFGVAKAVGRLQTTREGDVKGKLAYMAPEQLSLRVTTRAADIYAAGVVLWEMLTGRRLFQGTDDRELMAKVLAGPARPPSGFAAEIPEAADAVTMRGLARDPQDRFETALAMAEALVRAVPPALPTEVGAWVRDVAHDALAKRAAQLDGIESRAPGAVHATPAPDASAARTDGVLATAVSPPPRDARPARSRVVAGSVLGAVAVLGVAAALWRARAPADGAPPPVLATAAAAPQADVTPETATSAAPLGGATPGAHASAVVDVAASALPTSAASPARFVPAAPARRPWRGAGHKPDCNPPFKLDAMGVRVPKPGCY